MGEMYVFERPHLSFWFGCGIRATPLGSNFDGEEATERRNLRVRGLPLLRRVQMMKRHHVQLDHRIHRRQSLRCGSRCGLRGENTKFLGRSKLRRTTFAGRRRKKIELKAKALTVFVMPGCAEGNAVFQA